MSENPYEVFARPEDYWSWDKYFEQCDLIELSDVNRQRAKDSFKYLRGLPGENYLKAAAGHGGGIVEDGDEPCRRSSINHWC